MSTEMSTEYDKIIQFSLEASSLLEIGNAVRLCDNQVLLSSLDLVIQNFVKLIKSNHSSPVTVSTVIFTVKELLRRLATLSCSSPQSLPSLVAAIFSLISDPSLVTQVACMECVSSILCIYPGCLKPYRETIISLAKNGLYSGQAQLVKVSAMLVVSLHSSSGKSTEMSQLFDSCLQLLNQSLKLLIGEECDTATLPLSYYTPVLPPEGQDRLLTIINVISGLGRVLCYSLLISGSVDYYNVSLNAVMDVIWFATSCKLMSLSLTLVIQQVSWQLLLVVIQSFKSLLLPYSESIEALIAKQLQDETTPPLIISLVCKCIEEWINVRGYCSLVFISQVVERLCVTGHHCIETLNNLSNKKRLPCEAMQVWLLYYCMKALCVCLRVPFAQSNLPPIFMKGSYLLGCQLPQNVSLACIVDKANELKMLASSKITSFNLSEVMSMYPLSSSIDEEQITITASTTSAILTGHSITSAVMPSTTSTSTTSSSSNILSGDQPLGIEQPSSQPSPLSQSNDSIKRPIKRPTPPAPATESTKENYVKKYKDNHLELSSFVDEDSNNKNNEDEHIASDLIEDEEDKNGLTEINEEDMLMEIFD